MGNIYGHHERDIGEVSAAAEGVVEHDYVAGVELAMIDRRGYRHGHGAEVHGHVIAHGDDLARGIEDGAGVIAAFFDIGREGSAAQRGPHFFGDRVVEVLEDFEFDGIGHVGQEFTSSGDECGGALRLAVLFGIAAASVSKQE